MKIQFHKMHGFGNDFVIIEDFIDLNENQIKFICNRNLGIGCDQLLMSKYNPENKICEMKTYNSDGSQAKFCGNGARCLIGLGYLKKFFNINDSITLKNGDDNLQASINENQLVNINLGKVKIFKNNFYDLTKYKEKINLLNDQGTFVDIGNPHLIIFVKDFEFEIEKIGKNIQSDKINFPEGINISFVKIIDKTSIEIKTFERGVGLTNSCGSGASASAFSAYENNFINENNIKIIFNDSIYKMNIKINENKEIIMSGDFNYVFMGEIEI